MAYTSRSWRIRLGSWRIHHDHGVYIMILALILALMPVASAGYGELLLSALGLGTEFNTVDITGVQSYNIGEEGQAIVNIEHTVSPGTSGQDIYYLSDGSAIYSNYSCQWGYLFSSCNLGLSYLDRSLYVTRNDFQIIPKDKGVMTSILANYSGGNNTLGFGIGVKQISTYYYVISMDELRYLPIKTVAGNASQDIDLKIGYMTYEDLGTYINQVDNVASGGVIETFLSIWTVASTLISTLIYYFKLIFIDNPILAFIIAEIMILINALESRNMAAWWRNIINGHYALFEFLLRIVDIFIDVVSKVLSAFRII